jgi:hypothetical protein
MERDDVMDKILMLRFDVGDYVPVAFQRWDEFGLGDDGSNTFFYLADKDAIFNIADQASFMCKDNITVEQFYVVMFPAFDLSHYDESTQDYIWDCLMNSEFENAIWEITDTYPDEKQKRLKYSIEYQQDIDYWTGIDEGYFFIRTKGIQS